MTTLDTAYRTVMDERLVKANTEAQAAFHEMLILGCQWNPDALATRTYVAAERAVDDVLRDLQWEASKAELDAAIAAEDDDRGNHYLFPEGVIEGLPEFNGSFK